MKSAVSGVAGAVRINQLTMAGLTRAERHGKRLDETGKRRAINGEPPLTMTGLDLNALYRSHVEGVFVPSAKSKAMHLIVQFPKELVDSADADGMLHHAREFGKRVFGNEAIFADRIDRDEKSQHVVDLFVAPKYLKKTKHAEKVAISMTRHLKAAAEKYGEPPIPHGIGRAMQDAWFEYLRDEMGLEKVRRGSAKQVAGSDWKSAEQLRVEQLEELRAEAVRARDEGRQAGHAEGVELARQDADRIRSDAEADAKAILNEAAKQSEQIRAAAEREGMAQGLANAHALIRSEKEEAASAKLAAKKDREAAVAELAASAAERAEAKAKGLADAEQELAGRQAALDHREAAIAGRVQKAEEAHAKTTALQTGIEAWAAGDIVRAGHLKDGGHGLQWRDDVTKQRIKHLILPAWNEVWEAVVGLAARTAERTDAVEEEAKRKARAFVTKATDAVSTFLARYEKATEAERGQIHAAPLAHAVTGFLSNSAVQATLDTTDEAYRALLLQAAASGFVKLPSAGATRSS